MGLPSARQARTMRAAAPSAPSVLSILLVLLFICCLPFAIVEVYGLVALIPMGLIVAIPLAAYGISVYTRTKARVDTAAADAQKAVPTTRVRAPESLDRNAAIAADLKQLEEKWQIRLALRPLPETSAPDR